VTRRFEPEREPGITEPTGTTEEDPGSGSGAAALGSGSHLLAQLLLAHYDRAARDLPWRQETDPYRVWVSEVMLQQTRVETVVPYYRRWLRRFPDMASLASAPADEVLKAWEGLGYYGRARNLHRSARLVRERHAGVLPSDPQLLGALPGFGDYTVGAVASIAFGRRLPAVDGNVRRVLARVYDIERPGAAWLRATAGALVPAHRPGDFNQALMELGATICTPRAPRCAACPLAEPCRARAHGTVADRPARKARPTPRAAELGTAVVCDAAGRLLLVRNADSGLLAGMWAFPCVELAPEEGAATAAARAASAAGVAVVAATGRELEPVRHDFSHLRARYRPVLFRLPGTPTAGEAARWADAEALARVAMPVAHRKISEKLPPQAAGAPATE
jgi:A/G-specific adenine glycosylase